MTPASPLYVPGVRSIVVLRPNAVGDFVFALPALHALKQTYPNARLVYIGQPWHAEFLRDRPGPVDQVLVLPPVPGVSAPAGAQSDAEPQERFIATVCELGCDIAMQMYGGGRYSNPLVQRFGARITVGMKAHDAPTLERWLPFDGLHNRRMQLLEVAALAGAASWPMLAELAVTERDIGASAQVVDVPASQPIIVLQPGASDPRRRWPAARFAALADTLAQQGAVIAINGTEQEQALVHEVAARMRYPSLDLSGQLSLAALCGLLSRASMLISNDTGPLHLALALGTPCVGVYWLTNMIESGPLRQQWHRAAVSARVHCSVCGAENLISRCDHDASFVDGVTTDEVIALAQELLAATRGLRR